MISLIIAISSIVLLLIVGLLVTLALFPFLFYLLDLWWFYFLWVMKKLGKPQD